MKKIILLMSVLMLPTFLSAQDDDIDLPFDNEPLSNDSRAYFVLAGGLTYDFLMINEDNLNSFFDLQSESDFKLSAPIQLTGGQGVTGIPWVKNLRIGVFGYGGSSESEASEFTKVDISGVEIGKGQLQNSLTASMFGFSVHYGYVPFEHFAILGGLNAGWGDITYENFFAPDGMESELPAEYSMNRFEKNFFFLMPNIQFEYALANFIIIRADASYNLTVGQDENWTQNYLGTNSVNPDFDLSGLKVGFGVMVGLVNF